MISKVKQAITRYNMLTEGEAVTVALSGGADSTALLLALAELGYKVSCVHVNHNLRGEEALRDQSFCEELCKSLNLSLDVVSVDVRTYAQENKQSLEEAARNLRYDAITKHAKGKIATAHNLNDCFETTLFNLVRGTGLSGISGIPPVRNNVIRPLILSTREEILAYLSAKNQPWVEDSTNKIADCSRNILRLEVVPKLLKINPGMYKSYQSFLDTVEQSKEYIDCGVTEAYNDSLKDNSLDADAIPEGILRSDAVSLYLKNNGITPTHDTVSSILSRLGENTKINIKKGVYVKISLGTLSLERDTDKAARLYYSTPLNGDFTFGDKMVTITKLSPFSTSSFNRNDLKYAVDIDKLHGEVVARSTYGNETIRLAGRGFTSKVKKLFSQIASSADRPSLMVLSDDRGVFFAEGFGIDERVLCDEQTTHAVKIEIK